MIVHGRVIGAFTIYATEPFFFDETEIWLLEEVTGDIAFALEAKENEKKGRRAEEKLRRLVERLSIVYRADEEISSSLDAEQIYAAVYTAVEQAMPCEDFVISLYDVTRNEMMGNYIVEKSKRVAGKPYKADHGLGGDIVRNGRSLILNSPEQIRTSGIEFEPYGNEPATSSILAVPMQIKGKVIGVLSVQSYHSNAYTSEDQELLEMLTSHAAIAIDNARLFERAQLEITERKQTERALRDSEARFPPSFPCQPHPDQPHRPGYGTVDGSQRCISKCNRLPAGRTNRPHLPGTPSLGASGEARGDEKNAPRKKPGA